MECWQRHAFLADPMGYISGHEKTLQDLVVKRFHPSGEQLGKKGFPSALPVNVYLEAKWQEAGLKQYPNDVLVVFTLLKSQRKRCYMSRAAKVGQPKVAIAA